MDLFGADLSGGSLVETRLDNANLREAVLLGTIFVRADLQGADLRQAKLQDADLGQAKLRDADLRQAYLQGANLRQAKLRDADLRQAKLQRANLRQAKLQGANLSSAELQEADFSNANLQLANLSEAQLQGANLFYAKLQRVNLAAAKLQGADLYRAKLQGAVLSYVNLQGADLSQAGIWQTKPPGGVSPRNNVPRPLYLTDLTGVRIAPLVSGQLSNLQILIDKTTNANIKARLKARFEPMLDTVADENWKTSPHGMTWDRLSIFPAPNPTKLSDFLADLACKDDTGGRIIETIASRGTFIELTYRSLRFNGNVTRLAKGLTKKTCGPAANLDDRTRTKLCNLANWPEEGIEITLCAP